jgi:hypothetical protein
VLAITAPDSAAIHARDGRTLNLFDYVHWTGVTWGGLVELSKV